MGKNTAENLKEAFAGESQANRRYLAFAKKSEEEGYHQVAKLFRAAAEAETVHAHNHLGVMKGVRSTRENIQEAIGGETHEFKSMYPGMMETAKAEKNNEALRSFNFGQLCGEDPCGPLYEGTGESRQERGTGLLCLPRVREYGGKTVPDKCPICGEPGKNFIKIY